MKNRKGLILNKKGQTAVFLFFIILFAILGILFLGIGGIVLSHVNSVLDQNISVGQVNLQTVNNQTIGVLNQTYVNNADWYGLTIIFGMIFGFFISAYFLRNTYPKLWIILDVFIIIIAFILSLYISSTFEVVVNVLGSAGETFIEDNMAKSSMFLLNLPIFTTIVGVICMVLFHSTIPRKKEEQQYQSGGYLQGV